MATQALISGDTITLHDFTILVKPHARARRLVLRYSAKKACFTLSTPKRASRKSVTEFLQASQSWMRQQVAMTPAPVSMLEQGAILIEGRERRLVHKDGAGVQMALYDDMLEITCRPSRLNRAVLRFLQQRALQVISDLAHEKAARIGKKIMKITLRDTASRWGSCSHDGSLSFSWRLIMAPPETLDYVVAHEVAHLRYFDHSADFWGLCRELSAVYTKGKHWLELHGRDLQAARI